jgi:O-antigen/teichoic acid export membrane protein
MSESIIELTGPVADATAGDSVAALNGEQSVSRFAPKSIRANALWMLSGTAASAAARWFVVVLLAKLGSQELVGQYGWAVAFCMPTITFCRFGLRILKSTDARDEFRFGEYFAFCLIGTCLGMIVVTGLGVTDRLDGGLLILVIAVASWNSLESISDLFAGMFQRYERVDYLAKASILQAILMCVLMAVGLLVGNTAQWGACGLIVAALIRVVCYEMPVGGRLLLARKGCAPGPVAAAELAPLRPLFHWRAIRRLLLLGIPLTIVTFLIVYTQSVPRYVIRDFLGDSRLGSFVALFALASAQNLVVGSVSQSLLARFAILVVEGNRAKLARLLLKTVALAVAVGLPGLLIAAVAGKWLLALVFTPAYAADNDVFVILMLYGVLDGIGSVVGTMTSSMRRFTIQVPIQAIKLAIVYGGGVWAAKQFGLSGVAWVLVAASAMAATSYASLCFYGLRAHKGLPSEDAKVL